jgi:hypothetical protein
LPDTCSHPSIWKTVDSRDRGQPKQSFRREKIKCSLLRLCLKQLKVEVGVLSSQVHPQTSFTLTQNGHESLVPGSKSEKEDVLNYLSGLEINQTHIYSINYFFLSTPMMLSTYLNFSASHTMPYFFRTIVPHYDNFQRKYLDCIHFCVPRAWCVTLAFSPGKCDRYHITPNIHQMSSIKPLKRLFQYVCEKFTDSLVKTQNIFLNIGTLGFLFS